MAEYRQNDTSDENSRGTTTQEVQNIIVFRHDVPHNLTIQPT